MLLAIINKNTNKVVNTIVPPEGSDAFFIGAGFEGVLSNVAEIGDIYQNGQFVKSE